MSSQLYFANQLCHAWITYLDKEFTMIGYWQDQAGSIHASFFQFTIQTRFAIATFRRHPRDLPALVLLEDIKKKKKKMLKSH